MSMVVIGIVIACLLLLGAGYFIYTKYTQNMNVMEQQILDAQKAKDDAIQNAQNAEMAKEEALQNAQDAQKAKDEAIKNAQDALVEKQETEKQAKIAEAAKLEAKKQADDAKQAQLDAENKTQLALIEAKTAKQMQEQTALEVQNAQDAQQKALDDMNAAKEKLTKAEDAKQLNEAQIAIERAKQDKIKADLAAANKQVELEKAAKIAESAKILEAQSKLEQIEAAKRKVENDLNAAQAAKAAAEAATEAANAAKNAVSAQLEAKDAIIVQKEAAAKALQASVDAQLAKKEITITIEKAVENNNNVYKINNYSIKPNIDYAGQGDIYGMNDSLSNCKNKCDSMPDCYGFIRRESDNGCWLKNKNVSAETPNNTLNFYYKDNNNYGPWAVYKDISGTYVGARTYKDEFECISTDGVNCFWRGDYNQALNDVKNLPADLKPLRGKWPITALETPADGIDYIKGYFDGADGNESPLTQGRTPEDCRRIARERGAKAWGYRTNAHGSAEAKKTCFFYSNYLNSITSEGNAPGEHLTGCLNPGEKLKNGCVDMTVAEGIKYIKGYFDGADTNETTDLPAIQGRSPEDCRRIAKEKGYKAWGHRNTAHGTPGWRNTCFFYSKYPNSITSEGYGAGEHLTGCLNPEDKLKDGCKTVSNPNYSIKPNIDYGGQGDIFSMNDSLINCQNKCDSMSDCYGIIRRESDNGCWLKNKNVSVETPNNTLNFYYKNIIEDGNKYYLYGPWIGSDNPVQKISYAANDNIYMFFDGTYTKMVNDSGAAKYYQGDLSLFNRANWNSYSDATGGYLLKKVPNPSQYNKKDWVQIPGGKKQVSIDGNVACGVNNADDIYCKSDLSSGDWKLIPGKLKHISVSKGKLYGVNSSDEIFFANDYQNVNWVKIPGGLKQVDIDDNTVCGVNATNDVYCKSDLTSADWKLLPGKNLKHISISKGKLYGIDPSDNIYFANDYQNVKWTQIPGGLKQVDVDGNIVCGVNSGNNIYCKNDLQSANWELISGGLKYISVSNGNLYGTGADNTIWGKF